MVFHTLHVLSWTCTHISLANVENSTLLGTINVTREMLVFLKLLLVPGLPGVNVHQLTEIGQHTVIPPPLGETLNVLDDFHGSSEFVGIFLLSPDALHIGSAGQKALQQIVTLADETFVDALVGKAELVAVVDGVGLSVLLLKLDDHVLLKAWCSGH